MVYNYDPTVSSTLSSERAYAPVIPPKPPVTDAQSLSQAMSFSGVVKDLQNTEFSSQKIQDKYGIPKNELSNVIAHINSSLDKISVVQQEGVGGAREERSRKDLPKFNVSFSDGDEPTAQIGVRESISPKDRMVRADLALRTYLELKKSNPGGIRDISMVIKKTPDGSGTYNVYAEVLSSSGGKSVYRLQNIEPDATPKLISKKISSSSSGQANSIDMEKSSLFVASLVTGGNGALLSQMKIMLGSVVCESAKSAMLESGSSSVNISVGIMGDAADGLIAQINYGDGIPVNIDNLDKDPKVAAEQTRAVTAARGAIRNRGGDLPAIDSINIKAVRNSEGTYDLSVKITPKNGADPIEFSINGLDPTAPMAYMEKQCGEGLDEALRSRDLSDIVPNFNYDSTTSDQEKSSVSLSPDRSANDQDRSNALLSMGMYNLVAEASEEAAEAYDKGISEDIDRMKQETEEYSKKAKKRKLVAQQAAEKKMTADKVTDVSVRIASVSDMASEETVEHEQDMSDAQASDAEYGLRRARMIAEG